jgi:hypothetical protein
VVVPLAARILVARIRLLLLWSRVTHEEISRCGHDPGRVCFAAFAESAKPDDNNLSGKEMKDGATVQGGNTDCRTPSRTTTASPVRR